MPPARPPVRLVTVPYDSGHRDARMGAGPSALLAAGAVERLQGLGHAVTVVEVEPASSWRAELRTAFELQRGVAAAVADALAAGDVPLVLSGSCHPTVGAVGALTGTGRRVGLVWLDAHGDFNTPEEDPTGFLDGHGLAMAVGRCWTAATAQVPGFRPLDERDVVLVGARDLTAAQADVLRASAVTWLPPAQARDAVAVGRALDDLATRVDVVHVHVDLDVHDPSVAPANEYAAPDGLTADEVVAVVRSVAARAPVLTGTVASWDPGLDPEGRMRDVALSLLEVMAGVAGPAA